MEVTAVTTPSCQSVSLNTFPWQKGCDQCEPLVFTVVTWWASFFWKVNSPQRCSKLTWGNSRHLPTLPLVSREMTTAVETPYWWPVTYQIQEVLLIGPCRVGNLLQPISCHFAGKPLLLSKFGRESLSETFFKFKLWCSWEVSLTRSEPSRSSS